MTFLNVNFETQKTTLQSFDRIAKKISKDIAIKINEAYYRIFDFEFYTFSTHFPDPHTYKNELQLENGKLYLHGSGVDITFGDGINHGGILLRSIIKLYDGSEKESGFMKQQFDGPQNVATELFSNLNSLNSSKKNEISFIEMSEHHQDLHFYSPEAIIKTKRVGLTSKPIDKDGEYQNSQLRYIVVLPKFPNFKQTIKGIESLLREQVNTKVIDKEKAIEILGYKINFDTP
jgi:hypothetical protein